MGSYQISASGEGLGHHFTHSCMYDNIDLSCTREGTAPHSRILAWRIPRTEELADYSPWGHKESDTTEQVSARTHTHTHAQIYGTQVNE